MLMHNREAHHIEVAGLSGTLKTANFAFGRRAGSQQPVPASAAGPGAGMNVSRIAGG